MAFKVVVPNYFSGGNGSDSLYFVACFLNTSSNLITEYTDILQLGVDITAYTQTEIRNMIETKVLSFATNNSISITVDDIFYGPQGFLKKSEFLSLVNSLSRSFNYTPGRSIVTSTGAAGFQVSSTRDAMVSYSTKIVTTATIAGGQEGYVALEIAPTNSATAGDWKEVGRVTNGQALSLALTLQSIQPVSGSLSALVPAGYYAKVRSVNTTGTPSYTMISGQEVLL